jgi:hypothetical protein
MHVRRYSIAVDVHRRADVRVARHWRSVIDTLPIQLAAERLSRMRGVDCDSFRVCSFVVEDEHGLWHKKAVPTDRLQSRNS